MRSRQVIVLLVLVAITASLLIAILMHRQPTIRFLIQAGMSREEVITTAGVPKEKQSLVKAVGVHVDNQFWMQITDGTPVEVWEYRDRQGRVLVYFTDASQTVSGVSFLSNGQPF